MKRVLYISYGHRGDCVPGTGLDVECLDEELEAEHDGRES